MSKILFIPSRPYRSDPTFIKLGEILRNQDFYLSYIDFNGHTHQFHQRVDENIRKETLLKYFDKVKILDGREFAISHTENRIHTWAKIRKKSLQIRREIEGAHPDGIVVSFNHGLEFNAIMRYAKNLPVIFIQTVALNQFAKSPNTALKLKRLLYNALHINVYSAASSGNLHQFYWAKSIEGNKTKKVGQVYYEGNPLMDNLLEIGKNKNVNSWSCKSVAYVTQPTYDKDESSKALLWYLIENFINEECSMKVLVHPRDSEDFFRKEFAQYSPDVRYSSQFSNDELRNSICVTYSSVFGQELVARGIPLVIINPERKFDYSAIFPDDYPYTVISKSDLDGLINAVQSNSFIKRFWTARISFIQYVNTTIKSNSSENIVSKITEIVKG